MLRGLAVGVLACLALTGCEKKAEVPASSLFGSSARGRYLGVAVYTPGRMWAQVARTEAPRDAAAATLRDDEQVIVVVDSVTGELRQCGNLSGFCIAMNPWSRPTSPVAGAPAVLLKHAQQLDGEVKSETEVSVSLQKGSE
ncbi:MAG: hypothetical protein DI570_11835 [Phenylobacterium zucineum]|nr:MAG: hypothetical protein DI570_11835 [Phenylobacterium zucineum]